MGAPKIKPANASRLKVLLVEDDPVVGQLLNDLLTQEGYAVSWAERVSEAQPFIDSPDFHLVILDVNLPDGDGFDLCRKLRSEGNNTPVLMLTSRADEDSLVKGLALGANDYLRKPFGKRELLARLKLQLRGKKGLLTLGALSIDLDQKTVEVSGTPLKLTPTELSILAILARHSGDAVSRSTLLSEIDPDVQLEERTLDSHVSHLRKKLQKHGQGKITLLSAYGVGYRLSFE